MLFDVCQTDSGVKCPLAVSGTKSYMHTSPCWGRRRENGRRMCQMERSAQSQERLKAERGQAVRECMVGPRGGEGIMGKVVRCHCEMASMEWKRWKSQIGGTGGGVGGEELETVVVRGTHSEFRGERRWGSS